MSAETASISDSHLLPKSDHDIELDRLRNFPAIPDSPDEEDLTVGVLLSERIQRLCDKYKMIFPLNKDHLKPASYELSVGDFFSRAGSTRALNPGGSFDIAPFDVVLIQTLETLNLPRFVIARWNIRVKWAYKGLLWVGAPQVDPGFRGFLSCPLYNLSNKTVTLKHGDAIAAMDFVMTTPVCSASKRYEWEKRTRIVFGDYEKDRLESALLTEAARKIAVVEEKNLQLEVGLAQAATRIETLQSEVKNRIDSIHTEVVDKTEDSRRRIDTNVSSIQSRIDNYTARTLTVLAVLFAALGLAVSRSPDISYLSSATPLAAIALWFALRSFYWAGSSRSDGVRNGMWFEIAVGVSLAVILLTIQYKISQTYHADWTTTRDLAKTAQQDVRDIRRDLVSQQEVQRRLDVLEQKIDALKPPKATPK